MNNLSFGEKLASLRKEKGWSQEELANKLNVSRQAVSKWESNNAYPETDKIATICKLFNSSMDELIGLKSEKSNKNNFSSKINYYIDLFIKGIRMFYSMTFKQKIKCLIEFCFYSLILFLIFICVGNVIRIVLNYFFDILPFTLFNYFSKITFGIFILAYLILSLYILGKLYKIRYLDYYLVNYNTFDEKVKIKEEKSEINIKDEKIIIRDAENDVNPLSIFSKLLKIMGKVFLSFFLIPLAFIFVTLIAFLIFNLFYINKGVILIYTFLGIIAAILVVYIFIELIIRIIFSLKIIGKKYLIIFISSLVLFGIAVGLTISEVATYKIVENKNLEEKVKEIIIPMDDGLVINYLNHADIVYEDREDILVEFYAINKNIIKINQYKFNDYVYNDYNEIIKTYYVYDYYSHIDYDGNINDILNELFKQIKNKEIIIYDDNVKPKIHISKDNYEKIIKNYNY